MGKIGRIGGGSPRWSSGLGGGGGAATARSNARPRRTGFVELVQLRERAIDILDRFEDRQLERRLRQQQSKLRRRLLSHQHRAQQASDLNHEWIAAGLA